MFKLRFWWVLLKAFFARKPQPESCLGFWVTPFDCDINLHCNNASYLKYMDLGRWDLVIRLGLVKTFYRAKISAAATRVEIDFLSAMPPGTYFRLESRFHGLEPHRVIMEQTFYRGEKVVARAKVWAAGVRAGRSVRTEEIVALLPQNIKNLLAPGNVAPPNVKID